MKVAGVLITFGIVFSYISGLAQDIPKKELDASRLADEIFAAQDLDVNYQDLYENYLQLLSNPLELNKVTEEQLRALYILSPKQILDFITYRKESGPFLSVYELQSIPGFTEEMVDKLIPFVTVEEASSFINKNIFTRIAQEKNNYLLMRWARVEQPQKGYLKSTDSTQRYAGSPDNFYTRFRVSRPGDFSLGFTTKKDAGEIIAWKPSQRYYGIDFTSAHIQILNKRNIQNLIAGDYQSQFGQGIALGSAFGIGKNGEAVTTVRRSNLGFLPYTSLYEAGYFRGAAISYTINNKVTLHAMTSTRSRDGSLHQDTVQDASDYISSISYTGLHRTPSELANRNSIQETNLAGVLQYKKQSLDAGVLMHHTHFSVPLVHNPSVYNQFYFNGNTNTNTGAFLNFNVSNISFFSEFVQTLHHGRAGVAGILSSLTPQLDISLLYRKFDRNFYSFYSNALSETSTPQNESGIYWGWKYTFNKKYSLAGYVDLFRFDWLRYRSYAPSDGSEWLLRCNYKPSKTVSMFIQAREESKVRNTGAVDNLYLTAQGVKRSYWINADYIANNKLSFKSRVQFSTYTINGITTQGMTVLQDVSYDWRRFGITGRYALFDTDDYDNRIYVYERDAYMAFSFPAYYGKGIRTYLMIQFKLSQKIDLYLRGSSTQYTDRKTIGAGGETIEGNTRNDVKFQARIRI